MTNSSGMGCGGVFVSLLTVAFIVLKLTEVIDWAWGWVLSPLWISALVVLFLVIIDSAIALWKA